MKITESHTKLFGQGHLQPFQSNAILIADVKISRQETPDRFSATDPENVWFEGKEWWWRPWNTHPSPEDFRANTGENRKKRRPFPCF
jgi:hypothetical protein